MPLKKTVVLPLPFPAPSFYVYNPQGRPPAFPHHSKTSAEEEAKRLAALNKGQEFYVVRIKGTAYDVLKGHRVDSTTEVDPTFKVGERYTTSSGITVIILSTDCRNLPSFPVVGQTTDGLLLFFTHVGYAQEAGVGVLQHNTITKEKMTIINPEED